jgi:hypothetical protein
MHPVKTLVVDITEHKGMAHYPERYPGATVVKGDPTLPPQAVSAFLDGLDIAFTAESPYGPDLYLQGPLRGVKTVCQYNYEFLDQTAQPPTLYAAPTPWHYADVWHHKCLLPVPIATERFPYVHREKHPTHFLHIVGKPAVYDRNGTPEFLCALEHVRSNITATLYCQDPHYLTQLLRCYDFPDNIDIKTGLGDKPNYWDLYLNHDVLVMPRRFGGLCLPAQEALGAGMPVLMPDISPNQDLLPPEWLTPAEHITQLGIVVQIGAYRTDPKALAEKIDQMAQDDTFYAWSLDRAREIAENRSWKTLKPLYDKTFHNLMQQPINY